MTSVTRDRGTGVAYFEKVKKSDRAPDYLGFVVLDMDYVAGEKLKLAFWMRQNDSGLSYFVIKEDNYSKKLSGAKLMVVTQEEIPKSEVKDFSTAETLPIEPTSNNKNKKLSIEKSVAIPSKREIFKYPYAEMEVGDSFTVPTDARAKVLNANYRASKSLGIELTARTEGELVRIWRVS
jgi:hypothetical protein